ncbi:MAG: tetratricopeptide repeat protein [Bacteroidota bacterium]|jgi:tetratricopeptide (TPR) repeat protein
MSFFSSDWDDEEEDDIFQGDLDALVNDFESKSRESFTAREYLELFRHYASQFPTQSGQLRVDQQIRTILDQAIIHFPYMPIFTLHMCEWLIRDQKLNRAKSYIDKALKFNPFDPALGFMQSLIYSLQGNKPKAFENLEAILQNLGEEEALLEEFLEIALYHEQFELAMPILEKALDAGSEVSAIMEKYIEKAEENGLIAALIPMIEKIIDQDPYSAEAWFVLGSAFMSQDNHEKGLKALDYSVTINENFADAWIAYLECQYELGQYEDLIKTYHSLEEKFHKTSLEEIQGLLAWSYYETGDNKTCRALYKEILKKHPHDAEAWYSMGLTWHYEENYTSAIPYLEKAYDIDRFEPDYGMVLASAYFGANMTDKWEPLYQTLTLEHPNNPELWLDYITALHENGESEKSLDVIEQALTNNPQHPGLLYRFAALCHLNGQTNAALLVLERALELNPNEHVQLFTFAPELKKARAILTCISKFTTPRLGL